MERVAFLIERTGERLSCLLNPEALEMRRTAGLRTRRGGAGVLTGQALTDDPVIATGGGVTEIDLRLLFDMDIATEGRAPLPVPTVAGRGDDGDAGGAPASLDLDARPGDVRALTRPLWDLAENAAGLDGFGAPPSVRFIWGKAWNVPGVVLAVAERLERFGPDGAPRRSWVSLRLRRTAAPGTPRPPPPPPTSPQFETPAPLDEGTRPLDTLVDVATDADGLPLQRIDQWAAERYGDPAYGPLLAAYNRLDDMLRLPEGRPLALPPLPVLVAMAATGRTSTGPDLGWTSPTPPNPAGPA